MKKRSVFQMLIKNYIVFSSILVLIVLFTIGVTMVSLSSLMSDDEMPMITPSQLVEADYESINVTDLNVAGGWIEILNEEREVVFIKGDKKTTQTEYSVEDLVNLLGFQESGSYFYQSTSFQSDTGDNLILLVALPYDVVDYDLQLTFGVFDISHQITYALLISLLVFIVLFMLNIFLYSKKTSKKIQTPLFHITSVIDEMSKGDIEVRMDFDAEDEFLKIKDAFNKMADDLMMKEQENRRIEESKNQAFMNISHDLKTPITTIAGFSKALSEGMIKDEKMKEKYLTTIHQKAKRMAVLIDDAFALSKRDYQGFQLDFVEADILETLRVTLVEHYEQIEQRNMTINLFSDVESLSLKHDIKEMHRVFANLIGNAIIYNPEKTAIEIEVIDEKNTVEILIKDTGVGIPVDLQEMIFQPFVRGDSSRTSNGGSGLGLAIAKAIVEKHQGKIQLKTDDEVYKTIFIITLPKR